MEQIHLYAIWDRESGRFDNPFPAVSDVFAKRRFALMCDEDGPLKKWPEQFDLWRLSTICLVYDPVDTPAGSAIVEQNVKFMESATKYREFSLERARSRAAS